MKTFIILALVALYAIAATANSPLEEAALPGGWHIGQATLMDHTLGGLTERNVNAEITFYEGADLQNSACYGRNGLRVYNAKPSDFIGAMSMNKFEMCYQCLEIRNGKSKVKTVIVKIIDKCAGCPKNKKNVDLTKGAFTKLANPNDGRVTIMWRPLPNCPSRGAWPTFEQSKRKIRRSKFD